MPPTSRRPSGSGTLVLSLLGILLLPATPHLATTQEAHAVSPEEAALVRDTLRRPPTDHPVTLEGALLAPLGLATLPLHLALDGIAEVVGFLAAPSRYDPLVEAYRSLRPLGISLGATTELGARSGPGPSLAWSAGPLTLGSAVSIRGYRQHRVELEAHPGGWTVAARGRFQRRTQELYWRRGPDADLRAGADYALERWVVEAEGAWRPAPRVTVRVGGGWMEETPGRGTDPSRPDLQERFDVRALPGASGPVRLLSGRAGLAVSWSDPEALVPRRSVEVGATWSAFLGVSGTEADFGRLDLALETYLPVTSHQRLALRGFASVLDGTGTPFFHLPALGGGPTLRSFENDRFRGRAVLAGTVEWRWELWRDLRERARVEALLFLDGGGVGSRLPELGPARSSVGFGLSGQLLREASVEGFVAFGDEGSRIFGSLSLGGF